MTTVGDLFPSRFLKAEADFDEGESKTLTISRWEQEELGKGQQKETKPVIYFNEIEKGLVLNKTNAAIIADNLGTPTLEEWVGKQVVLFTMEVDSFGDIVRAIRVKPKAKGKAAQAPVAKPIASAPEGSGNGKSATTLKVAPGFDLTAFRSMLVLDEPHYAMKDGATPNPFHITKTILKLGFTELNDGNANEVLLMLKEYAKQEKEPLPT